MATADGGALLVFGVIRVFTYFERSIEREYKLKRTNRNEKKFLNASEWVPFDFRFSTLLDRTFFDDSAKPWW